MVNVIYSNILARQGGLDKQVHYQCMNYNVKKPNLQAHFQYIKNQFYLVFFNILCDTSSQPSSLPHPPPQIEGELPLLNRKWGEKIHGWTKIDLLHPIKKQTQKRTWYSTTSLLTPHLIKILNISYQYSLP